MTEQNNTRHKQRPHPYSLETFHELQPILIGPDGLCDCVEGECKFYHLCKPDRRCSLKELRQHDQEAVLRRAWQSGE